MYDSLARYYDLIHSSLTADREYIIKLADMTSGPILEMGCGTGRLIIPLARAGHTLTGVDNSSEMLAIAHTRLEQEPLPVKERVDLVEADIKSLSLPRKDKGFSLILLPYNTLLHFKTDEIQQLLRSASRYLRRDGQLFIDVSNPFAIDQLADDSEPSLEDTFLDQDTGETIHQFSQSRLDTAEQCLHTSWFFDVGDGLKPMSTRTAIQFDYWYYYPHQLQLLLQHAGFRLEQMLGDYDESPFTEESDRLLVIARQSPK